MKLVPLIALVALTTAASVEIQADAKFEVPKEEADKLIADGKAKLDVAGAPAPAGKGSVQARVLVDCSFGKANDVVTVSADELKSNAGVLDGAAAAVAYAKKLAAEAARKAAE